MKSSFKYFLAFFIFVLLFLPANAKNESITIISDARINADKTENKMTPSVEKLLKAVNQANADTSDCVVFLGDNVSSANRIDIAMFAKIIRKVKKPCYVTLGNRDISKTKGILKQDFYKIVNKFSSNKINQLPSYKKRGEYVFVFLGGVNETFPSMRGYYKTSELDFLNKTLNKFENKKVIIFQHFPVVMPKNDPDKATYKPELYENILEKHKNVIAVISGHFGYEKVTEKNGIKHISAPALSQSGEYEQIKIFLNKNGGYSVTTRIISVE